MQIPSANHGQDLHIYASYQQLHIIYRLALCMQLWLIPVSVSGICTRRLAFSLANLDGWRISSAYINASETNGPLLDPQEIQEIVQVSEDLLMVITNE